MSAAVQSWLATLAPESRQTVEALRAVVTGAAPELVEEIKWNAPSFRDGAVHKVTLGIERKGGVRIVLHRGVAKQDLAGWSFDDPDRLATWAAPDRGVMRFSTEAEVEAHRDSLEQLIVRWIAATR